jgi:hypothetical protein
MEAGRGPRGARPPPQHTPRRRRGLPHADGPPPPPPPPPPPCRLEEQADAEHFYIYGVSLPLPGAASGASAASEPARVALEPGSAGGHTLQPPLGPEP